MKTIFKIFIILTWVLMISCEKDIDIDIPEKDPVLVVNSIFNNDSTWSVILSKSMSVKSPDTAITYIKNATIDLLDSAGNLIEKLEFQQGRYVSPSGKMPQIGNKYQLSVKASGFDNTFAKSYIPDSNKFKNITISKGKSIDKRYNQMADFLLFEAILIDNPKTKDFYIVEFYCSDSYSLSKNEIEGNDNYFESFPSTVSQQSRVFFTDETFNGQEKKIKLKSNIGSLSFLGMPPELLPNLYFKLYSVSEELFKYLVSYYRQSDCTEFEYTNHPIRVDNNIVNGLGIFGGYTNTDFPIDKYTLTNVLQ